MGGLPPVSRPAYEMADTPPTSTNHQKSFLLRSGVRVSCRAEHPGRGSLRTSRSASRSTSREHIAVADRYFTPAEANELLPTVRPSSRNGCPPAGARRRDRSPRPDRDQDLPATGAAFGRTRWTELQATIDDEAVEIVRCATALQELGLLVKDLDEARRLPALLRGDEEVLLCWRLGEDEVAFWHSLDEGFAGRSPSQSNRSPCRFGTGW